MVARNPPPYMQNRTDHTAENDRLALMAWTPGKSTGPFSSQSGVRYTDGNDLKSLQNGTPNMTINLNPGVCWVQGSEGTTQGVYVGINDAVLSIAIAASNPTNPRKDAIVYRTRDAIYSGANNDGDFIAVTGTPSGSPVLPTLPNNSVLLAEIAVAALATTVVTGNITDRRVLFQGDDIVCTSTTRPSNPAIGQNTFETDTNEIRTWNGTFWTGMHAGKTTQTSDASGNIIITHGCGYTPSGVVATYVGNGGGPGGVLGTDSYGATTFRVRHQNIAAPTSLTTAFICFP